MYLRGQIFDRLCAQSIKIECALRQVLGYTGIHDGNYLSVVTPRDVSPSPGQNHIHLPQHYSITPLQKQGYPPLSLSTISDFQGLCAFCLEYQCNVIEMVSRDRGLVYDNVVPACRACSRRRQDGYEHAEDRVRVYLSAERVQHFIAQSEEEPA